MTTRLNLLIWPVISTNIGNLWQIITLTIHKFKITWMITPKNFVSVINTPNWRLFTKNKRKEMELWCKNEVRAKLINTNGFGNNVRKTVSAVLDSNHINVKINPRWRSLSYVYRGRITCGVCMLCKIFHPTCFYVNIWVNSCPTKKCFKETISTRKKEMVTLFNVTIPKLKGTSFYHSSWTPLFTETKADS